MTAYRFLIRHNHIDEDQKLAADFIKSEKASTAVPRLCRTLTLPASESNERSGLIQIVFGTQEELGQPQFAEYEPIQ